MASFCDKFSTFYRRTVRIVFALCACWLFVSSLVFRNFIDVGERSWLTPNATLLQCLIFCLVCFLCLRCRAFQCPGAVLRWIRWLSVLCAVLLTALWAGRTWSVPVSDARLTQYAAECIHKGIYTHFERGEYMYFYPHQSGLVLLHWALQFLSPDDTKLFLALNVLSYGVILVCLGELAKAIGGGITLSATWIGILFYPLAMYTVFIYGTLLGLAFSLVGLLLVIGYCEKGKVWRCILGAISIGIAIALKSNYQIFAIGAILYSLYHALRHQKRCFLLVALLITTFLAGSKMPVVLLEHLTGYSLREGLPHLGWVCMGLQDTGPLAPGWFNDYVMSGWYYVGGKSEYHIAFIKNDLLGVFVRFARNPLYAVQFFIEKNATQWNDPTFQGFWINQTLALYNETKLPVFAEKLLSPTTQNLLTRVGSYFTTLVYGGLILWAFVPSSEKRKSGEDLLAVILVGGFVFHTFWEAKSQYTLPYFVTVLPLALQGYRRLHQLPAHRAEAAAQWHCTIGKLRWVAPVLLLVLALILSLFLSPQYAQNLQDYLASIS